MADEGYGRLPARVGNRLGDPGGARANIIDADQIRMTGNQPLHEGFILAVMIAALNRAQNAEVRILQTHHLVEAENPLRVVAQRLRPGDDADLAGSRSSEPSHQRPGRSSRGDIVDADV